MGGFSGLLGKAGMMRPGAGFGGGKGLLGLLVKQRMLCQVVNFCRV